MRYCIWAKMINGSMHSSIDSAPMFIRVDGNVRKRNVHLHLRELVQLKCCKRLSHLKNLLDSGILSKEKAIITSMLKKLFEDTWYVVSQPTNAANS